MNTDALLPAILDRVLRGQALSEVERKTLLSSDDFGGWTAPTGQKFAGLDARLQLLVHAHAALKRLGYSIPPVQLWSRHFPLAEHLIKSCANTQTCLIGIAGVPGTGKTSLTTVLATILITMGRTVAQVSLDDFYLSPEERAHRGYKWRAVPGTHDLKLLQKFVRDAKSAGKELSVPRYDTRAEKRLEPLAAVRPQLVLIEGMFVGAAIPGYEFLANALDYLIYIDADLEWAHQSRISRERRIREESGGELGLSAADTETFWQEALLPASREWILPLKEKANLVLEISGEYEINSFRV